ncbi:MAG: ATP-grasp domain-containing protein [Nitrososphaerota archaeon]|nr:ATP-grasp domain-containing protein [Candidatus Bathyarchaeota archaeon]MCX8162438.1 ATP-grasp domain-containing protein [Candidatus Bathyarchaeota archaeon]MDW8062422.1 ATP-grasp domain-containing protein [Nitrososphaerota archaeon]
MLRVAILYNTPVGKTDSIEYISEAGVLEEVEAVRSALESLGLEYSVIPLNGDIIEFAKAIKDYDPDVAVNLCEGAFGHSMYEMNVAALLELLRVPYTGSDPLTLALARDKGMSKDIFRARGIPTPEYRLLKGISDWDFKLGFPLIVKPAAEDASIGLTRRNFVRCLDELKDVVERIVERYDQPALVEEYIAGRELNVAFIGGDDPMILPISEIVFEFEDEPRIVDYYAKWVKGSYEYERTKPVCPAPLDEEEKARVEDTASKAYKALRCRDYGRVDIRLRSGVPYVLEVNPNPDISPDSGFVRSLNASGIRYEEFIAMIISYALERFGKLNEGSIL